MRVCLVQRSFTQVETFIRAHAERLPGVVGVVSRDLGAPALDGRRVLPEEAPRGGASRLARFLQSRRTRRHDERAYETAFRQTRADVVLAEYGTAGVRVLEACRRADVPLVVHFHGADASKHDVLKRYGEAYRRMFDQAKAVIAVSRTMESQLISLGCPSDKVIYIPYGVDCERFTGARPGAAPPRFLAVGRMVEKKAPNLTLAAFARALSQRPDARLRMVGSGELFDMCRALATSMAIDHAVSLLGVQPHEIVREEMLQARAFVQHSMTAPGGDSEGTPVAILEASAAGLPIVATRHAGIPDVVVEGKTGFLVDEGDTGGMARHLVALADDPGLADEIGGNAARHVRRHFTLTHSIGRLARVLEAAAAHAPIGPVHAAIREEFQKHDASRP
jgi:colanic acid/amylovoran biosynthesis glycosyltransferase